MTGFGRGQVAVEGTKFLAEVSSVNRKQADITVSLPKDLNDLEKDVRGLVADRVSRGRVSVKITVDSGGRPAASLRFDRELAEQYADALGILSKSFGGSGAPSASDLLKAPGVFTLEEGELEPEVARDPIGKALKRALDALDKMRRSEGGALRKDIASRLESIEGHAAAIKRLAPAVTEHYRQALQRRLRESGVDLPLDDDRLLKEVAVFADRCDISEELTRLASHLRQFRKYIKQKGAVGRELDFLSQELNREANTIGSKANSAEIASHVVETKAEIERIREQVQNVE